MLQQMRDKAQNLKWILWAVIFSFLISFVVIFQGGVGDVSMMGGRSSDAARVGGRRISESEFREALINQEETLRQILGEQYQADRFLNPRGVLDALIERAILLEEADRIGIAPSDDEIRNYLREISAFHDAQGKFDLAKYKEYLQRSGQRPSELEARIADDLRVNAMNRILDAGAGVSTAAVKEAWRRENETASIELVVFPLDPHLASVSATEDEIAAHFQAHADEYDAGPARQIRVVRFSRDEYQKALEKEDELRAYYDENVGAIYTMTEDQRRASAILVAVAASASEDEKAQARAKAEAAASRARAGEDFAALARELSDDGTSRDKGGDLGPFYRGFQEPAVDEAVFAAAEGDVVGPIETLGGFQVLRVTKGPGVKARTFEDVRDLVARGLYAKASADAQAAALEKFQEALSESADFEKAAAAAGVKPGDPVWVSRGGSVPGLESNPMVVARAFELEPKAISDPIADVGGQVVLQVLEEREKSPKSLDEARPDVERAVKERKARDLARAAAEAFRAQASAAESLEAALQAPGAPAGLSVQAAPDLRRGRSVPGLGLAPDVAAAAFETAAGQVARVADAPDGAVVLRVTARTEFDEARFEAERDALAQRLTDQRAAALRTSALAKLREDYGRKIKVNEQILAAFTPASSQGG